jgi:hypothetical protein
VWDALNVVHYAVMTGPNSHEDAVSTARVIYVAFLSNLYISIWLTFPAIFISL